jgi:hypothetical protein
MLYISFKNPKNVKGNIYNQNIYKTGIVTYLQQFIVQLLANWLCASTYCGTLGLYAALVSACCTQLEKIQTALLDIKQWGEEPESVIKDRLAQCVQHHQKVLR